MFDEPPENNFSGDEPDWEEFFFVWVQFLKKCAEFHGLELLNNKLVLPEGQNEAMLSKAIFQALKAKEKLYKKYPHKERLISKLPF